MASNYMVKVYADLIRKGKKTIEEVPDLLLLYILMGKEVAVMAVVYATLIVKGKKTIDQVPSLIRKQVEEILADLEVTV